MHHHPLSQCGYCGAGDTLLLVSDDFQATFFTDRMAEVLRRWRGEIDLPAFCYTVEEFERKRHQLGFVQEAVKHRIRLR